MTAQEAVASVARRVGRLEALGLARADAILRAAGEIGIEREKVRWCVDTTSRRHRAALAVAA